MARTGKETGEAKIARILREARDVPPTARVNELLAELKIHIKGSIAERRQRLAEACVVLRNTNDVDAPSKSLTSDEHRLRRGNNAAPETSTRAATNTKPPHTKPAEATPHTRGGSSAREHDAPAEASAANGASTRASAPAPAANPRPAAAQAPVTTPDADPEVIPATPPPAADEDVNPARPAPTAETADAAAPTRTTAEGAAATATSQTAAAATSEGAPSAGPTAAAAPPATAAGAASFTKLSLGEGMDAYAAVARTLAAVHSSTTGIDEKPNISAVSTLCGDMDLWPATAYFTHRGQAADAAKVLNSIIAAQHADAAQHDERAPTDATAILRDALTAHHTQDCVLNPTIKTMHLCAGCAELDIETRHPATVAYDRKSWTPLYTRTGVDVSEGDQCKRCGQVRVTMTTITPMTIPGTDYGLITLEGHGLPSVLTWGPHKATLIAGLAKTKDKVWATVTRDSSTGTEKLATAKRIAPRKEEPVTMALYKVQTTTWTNPDDEPPAQAAATPPTASDRNTAPREEQQPTNAPPRRNRGDKNTVNRNTRRFRRVHVTGPGIARASAGDLLVDLSAIEVTHYGRFAIATLRNADAADNLMEHGTRTPHCKALRATLDKPWLRKQWQPRDQASLRDTPPPPPADRPPHGAAQRPKAQQAPQPQQASQQQQQPQMQQLPHLQQAPPPPPPQVQQQAPKLPQAPQQAPQQQQLAPPQQVTSPQQQRAEEEQAQQQGRQQAQRDAQLHAQQLAREQEQQRTEMLNDMRAALWDLLRAELPNAVAAFVGPQQNLQQPSFYYPNMGFPGPRTGMGFPAAPMGMGHQAWPPAPISSQ